MTVIENVKVDSLEQLSQHPLAPYVLLLIFLFVVAWTIAVVMLPFNLISALRGIEAELRHQNDILKARLRK